MENDVTTFEGLSIAVAAATMISNLAAALFVGVQVRQAAKQTRRASQAQQDEWVKERKRVTIEFFTRTMELNKDLKANLPFRDRNKVSEFLERAEHEPAVASSIRAYLDYLEAIATGVNEGVLDIEVVDRMQGGRIAAVVVNYKSYIDRRRNDLNAPTLYKELEQLGTAIHDRRVVSGITTAATSVIPPTATRPPTEQAAVATMSIGIETHTDIH